MRSSSFPDVSDLLLLDHVALPQDLHRVHVTRVKLLHQPNLKIKSNKFNSFVNLSIKV